MNQKKDRREFIRSVSTAVIGVGIADGMFSAVSDGYGAEEKARVAVVRNERAISTRNVCDKKQVASMLEKGLLDITDKLNIKDAWTALGITKDDVIGMKVNCNSWTFLLSTHPELVYSLCESLSVCVPLHNIIIYERYTGELARAGYQANKNTSGIRCFGTDDANGFHPQEGLTRIVTDMCTKIINIPSLKTVEGEFGGSLFLKNHIGSISPGQMTRCHGNAEFCTIVCAQPSLKSKTVLAVCDGLRGTYKSGVPWYWSGIIMSRDQIAAEYTALQVINEKRMQEKERLLQIPSYVKMAETSYGLGTCTLAHIDLIRSVM